jgi:uncharacterized RDD family membrane protein YckC
MYCPICGTEAASASSFCFKCGGKLPVAVEGAALAGEAVAGQAVPAKPMAWNEPVPVATSDAPYAGFFVRLLAFVIDGVVVGLLGYCIALLGVWIVYNAENGGALATYADFLSEMTLTIVCISLSAISCLLYFAIFEKSSAQATLGKRIMRIKVVGLNGERIGFGRALARTVAKAISFATAGFGFFMAGFTGRKQALHDKLAGCLVVRRAASPQAISSDTGAKGMTFGRWAGGLAGAAFSLSLLVPVLSSVFVRWQDSHRPDDPKVAGGHASNKASP